MGERERSAERGLARKGRGVWRSVRTWALMAVMVALAGVDLVGSPVAVPEAEASTNSHWVQGVYMVPSGAPRSDREWVVDTAMKQTQAQWANFGLTFNLAPITTVYSGKSCGDYQADPLGAAYEDLNGNGRRNIHFMVYNHVQWGHPPGHL